MKTISVNSGGWQTVATRTLNIQLEKGRNVIRLSNPSNWMPDIDYIQLECLAPTAINAPVSASNTSGQAYDLQGRKVNADDVHHDVIIVDGRKIRK